MFPFLNIDCVTLWHNFKISFPFQGKPEDFKKYFKMFFFQTKQNCKGKKLNVRHFKPLLRLFKIRNFLIINQICITKGACDCKIVVMPGHKTSCFLVVYDFRQIYAKSCTQSAHTVHIRILYIKLSKRL